MTRLRGETALRGIVELVGAELRVHARISVDLPCEVTTDEGLFDARINNLSRGGAMVIAPLAMARVGDSLTLEVELPEDGAAIAVLGEVRRVVPDGVRASYGIQFSLVEPKQQEHLRRFIDTLLAGVGPGSRQHPRVHRYIEVECRTIVQFRSVADNISRGGMAILCDTPVSVDEQLMVEICVADAPLQSMFEIPGIVTHVRTTSEGQFHVGLRFELGSPEKNAIIDDFLRWLMQGDER